MRTTPWHSAIVLLLALRFYFGCSLEPLSGGTSTSENGRVVGMVVDTGGSPASQTVVVLLPAVYNPVKDTETLFSDTTDLSGAFRFSEVTVGEYSLQSRHIADGTRALTGNVMVRSDTDSVVVNDLTLRKPGSIKIAVPKEANRQSGYVYIPVNR